jgi:DNA ligase-1
MKPLLAAVAPAKLTFPLYVSPKLDGIRALCRNGSVLSRALKPIPNHHIQDTLSRKAFHGLDGELVVGPPSAPNAMQVTSSGVMSREGKPEFTYWVFDYWHDLGSTWDSRWATLRVDVPLLEELYPFVKLVPHRIVASEEELLAYEAVCLEQGYEGVMLRHPEGLYKYGRSTAREQYLMKLKRFVDSEAEIIDFDPKFHNANEQTRDERGYAKRSSHKENLVALDTLGALFVRDLKTNQTFRIGTGFDDELRWHIWKNRKKYLKAIVTYKSFPGGVKDAPRFPVFKAFRDRRDMS